MLTPSSIMAVDLIKESRGDLRAAPGSRLVLEPLQVLHQRARRELLAVEQVADEQAHEALGLGDRLGVLEPTALHVDERRAPNAHGVARSLAFPGDERTAAGDIPVVASRLERRAAVDDA